MKRQAVKFAASVVLKVAYAVLQAIEDRLNAPTKG